MELRPAGGLPPSPPTANAAAGLTRAAVTDLQAAGQAAVARVATDSESLLKEWPAEDLEKLALVLSTGPEASAGEITPLLEALVQHAQDRNIEKVETSVRELAGKAPVLVETLEGREELAPVRAEVAATLRHLTVAAKAEAEHAVVAAYGRTEHPEQQINSAWKSRPEALLDVCEKLIAFGGLTNYRKAEALARTVGIEGTVVADIPMLLPAGEARGLRLRKPLRFDELPPAVKFGAVLLVVMLALIWLLWAKS